MGGRASGNRWWRGAIRALGGPESKPKSLLYRTKKLRGELGLFLGLYIMTLYLGKRKNRQVPLPEEPFYIIASHIIASPVRCIPRRLGTVLRFYCVNLSME